MPRKIKTASTAAALAAIMGVAAACGSTPHSPTTNASVHPTRGGTIEFAELPQSNLNWFFPLVNTGFDSVSNFQLIYQLYKPLIWVNANYTINWHASIADKITYNKAGTMYHVFLNPKWHWSNGKPVTSQDILFTWDVIKATSAPSAPQPWPYVGAGTGNIPNGIQSIVADGSHEVTITLKKPANQQWFIDNGIIQLIPMPKAAWDIHKNIIQEVKYLGAEGTNPQFDQVVDGPFKMGPTT